MASGGASALEAEIRLLLEKGHSGATLPLAERLLQYVPDISSVSPEEAATTFALLAEVFRANHETEKAQSWAEKALSVRQQMLGPSHVATGNSLSALAAILKDRAQFVTAREYYEKALAIVSQELGDEHPDALSIVHDLGMLFATTGDLVSARRYFERALLGMTRIHGDEHLDTANCRNSLAGCLWRLNDLGAARHELDLALEVRSHILGRQHPDTADTLSSLGLILSDLGEHESALEYLKEALAIVETIFGADHPRVASVLNNVALVRANLGHFAIAQADLERVLKIYRSVYGDDHPETAHAHDNLGASLAELGASEDALQHLRQSQAIRERTFGENHPDTLVTLGRIALLLDGVGHHAQARPLHERVLAARRLVLGDSHSETYVSLNNLGKCLLRLGDLRRAREHLESALTLSRTTHLAGDGLVATLLTNLGSVYDQMGDALRAEQNHRTALELRRKLFGPHHPETAESLTNVAGFLENAGDLAQAQRHYEQALDAYQTTYGHQHHATATCRNNLGLLLAKMGAFEAAEDQLDQALKIRQDLFGDSHASTANSWHNLGYVRMVQGDAEGARTFLERALATNRSALGSSNLEAASTLSNLMCLCAGTGMPERAFGVARELSHCGDELLMQVFGMASERQRAAVRDSVRKDFHAILSFILRDLSGDATAVMFALDLVLRRKAIGLEALIIQRNALRGQKYSHLHVSFHELTALKRTTAAAALAASGNSNWPPAEESRAEERERRERLEELLASKIDGMTLEDRLRASDGRAVVQALPDGIALIEFLRYEPFDFDVWQNAAGVVCRSERYVAFVASSEGVSIVDLGEAGVIDELVDNFNKLVSGRPDTRPLGPIVETGIALRAAVFEPLLSHVANNRGLIFAPDGSLSKVSFAMLPSASGRLLMDDFSVSYLSVGRDVVRFNYESSQPGLSVVVADPAFNLSAQSFDAAPRSTVGLSSTSPDSTASGVIEHGVAPAMRFMRLRGSHEEGERIAKLLGVKPLLCSDALDSVIKKIQSPKVLHFATHGFFLPGDPGESKAWNRLAGPGMSDPLLRSGLALAGANVWLAGGETPADAEDGLLTAEDVTHMDLGGTELVVLSACETGLGAVYPEEGVFGLRRAFMLAGAKRLVMSLWKVPDRETLELMLEFYRVLLCGAPASEALRAAQQALRGRGHSDPFYWGAFILQGDPGPMLWQP